MSGFPVTFALSLLSKPAYHFCHSEPLRTAHTLPEHCMPYTPPRPRPVAPVHRAFDDLKAAEEEALRQIRCGHIFETDNAVLKRPRRD